MSTRAIIGIENSDGTITGAWQWNDGLGLAPLLRSQFNTLEKAKELIKNGVWNNIVAPKETDRLRRYMGWTENDDSCYYLVSVGECHLLKEKPNDTAAFCFAENNGVTINVDGSMTFANFEITNEQDIDCIYLFQPETNEWKIFRTSISAMETDKCK